MWGQDYFGAGPAGTDGAYRAGYPRRSYLVYAWGVESDGASTEPPQNELDHLLAYTRCMVLHVDEEARGEAIGQLKMKLARLERLVGVMKSQLPVNQISKGQQFTVELLVEPDAKIVQANLSGQSGLPTSHRLAA